MLPGVAVRAARPRFTGRVLVRLLVCATVVAMAAGAAAARIRAQGAAQKPLLFLDDRDYPPHSYLQNGVATGSEVEVANAIGRALGRPVKVELLPWAEAQQTVQRGDADALLDFSITDARRANWDFSVPIFTHDFGLFVRTSEARISNVESLNGMRVGVVRGGFPAEFLRDRPGVTLTPFANYDEGFAQLATGTIDAVAADTWVGAFAIQQRALRGITMAGVPFATRSAGIAVRKGNTALLSELDGAVRALTDDGTLAAIHARWEPEEIVFLSRQRFDRYLLWGIAGFVVVMGVALLIWIVTLKRQIAKREAAERALAESRERLSVAVDAAEMGTWRWTAATDLVEADATLKRILGLAADAEPETLAVWFLHVHPDDRDRTMAVRVRAVAEHGVLSSEFRIVRPDGTIRWLRSEGRPFYDSSGAPAYVTGVGYDITDRKAAELALRESQERFQKAFIASPAAVTISDFETGIIEMNQRLEEVSGYSRAELIGRTIGESGLLVEASHRPRLIAALREHGTVHDFEFKIRRKDGEVRLMSLSAAVLDVQGRPNFLSFSTDITDQRRLEASLQQASEINRLLVSELDPESLYAAITRSVGGAVNVDHAGLLLYDKASQTLTPKVEAFYDGRSAAASGMPAWDERPAASMALAQGDVMVFNRRAIEDLGAVMAPLLAGGLQTLCCAPLNGHAGPLGVLTLATRREGGFAEDDLAVVRQLATYVAIAIKNAQTYDELRALRSHLVEEKLYLEEELRVDHNFQDIIGASPALLRVLAQIETVAPTDSTVLLLGETGTGKELLARAIHDRSQRRDHTFVRVNAAALPGTLLESELFGYERGAFTGATGTKVGRFELAHLGSLFLDEVGDIPVELQPKLLRVLQEREFERLGGTRVQRVDVRLIAATNRDLDAMVAEGGFRSDLFYRLNVFPIQIPPLRERPEDIPLLVRHFVRRFSTKLKRGIDTIPAGAMAALMRWHWPGNIRELQNVIERAVILSQTPVLQVPLAELAAPPEAPAPIVPSGAPSPSAASSTLADKEREEILRALRASNGMIAGATGAAARLGLKRTTLQSKMRKLGITRPSF